MRDRSLASIVENGASSLRGKELVAVALLFFAILAGYANSFYSPFVYDDLNNIVANPNVHASHFSLRELSKSFFNNEINSRPLAYLSFAVNHAFHGLSVFGYHLVNFIVHFAVAVVLFFLFRTMLLLLKPENGKSAALLGAFLAALLWAVHPIQANAVSFIVQRMTSMCGLFFFLAIWFYVMARTGRMPAFFFVLCGACFLLALGFKENALLLPLNFGLIEIIFFETKWSRRQKLIAAVMAVALLTIAALRAWMLWGRLEAAYADRYFTVFERLLTEPRILFFYLGLMAFPWTERFALLHDAEVSRSLFSPATTLPAVFGVLLLIFWALWMARRQRLLSFAILFFFLNHLLESTILPLELVYEHRNYVPSAFLFLPVGAALASVWEKGVRQSLPALLAVIFAGLFVALSIFSVHEINRNFSSEERLWRYHIKKYPAYSLPHSHLGEAYWQRSMTKACVECRAAVELNRFNSKSQAAMALYNTGVCHLHLNKDPKTAISLFRQALKTIPDYIPGLNSLSLAQLAAGDTENALETATGSLSYFPKNPALSETLALIFVQKKEYEKAVETAKKALAAKAGATSFHAVIGAAFARMGDLEKSAAHWDIFLKDYSMDIRGLVSLAYLNARLGRRDSGGVVDRLFGMIPPGQVDEFIAFCKADPVFMLYVPLDDDLWPIIKRILEDRQARNSEGGKKEVH
ncbi:MAG: tetratricopeptide repeat protein [Deltaproteobacteria bacterium]|nr:tetratricopeptide repeat protein [Deltaproteobacteria bacterium]